MPISPENRHHYRTPAWRLVCGVVDERANGRCERCGSPDGMEVKRVYGTRERNGVGRLMFWRLQRWRDTPWIDQHGREIAAQNRPPLWDGNSPAEINHVLVVLTRAHLNQDPSDNRPENVEKLCQWCHNMHDGKARAENARQTRCQAKDGARPLILTEALL